MRVSVRACAWWKMSNDKSRWMPNENIVTISLLFSFKPFSLECVKSLNTFDWPNKNNVHCTMLLLFWVWIDLCLNLSVWKFNRIETEWTPPDTILSKKRLWKLHIYTHDKVILKHWLLSFWAILYPNFRLLYQTIFGVHVMICFVARSLTHSVDLYV